MSSAGPVWPCRTFFVQYNMDKTKNAFIVFSYHKTIYGDASSTYISHHPTLPADFLFNGTWAGVEKTHSPSAIPTGLRQQNI